jgi:hypothetical protein
MLGVTLVSKFQLYAMEDEWKSPETSIAHLLTYDTMIGQDSSGLMLSGKTFRTGDLLPSRFLVPISRLTLS